MFSETTVDVARNVRHNGYMTQPMSMSEYAERESLRMDAFEIRLMKQYMAEQEQDDE